jgi:glycosyltransferase involved in cell wall biosynthesis
MNEQSNPTLTVLMPSYNAGPYIAEAIDSVLQQTFTDFEFIIINDGSTDNTMEVLRRYTDPRIKVVDQANKGVIDSLNGGIMMAKGTFIARMDADDICLPHRLQTEYDFLGSHPEYDMVGSEADVIDKDGNFLLRLEPIGYSHQQIAEGIDKKCPFIHPSVMFRKDMVIKAGLYPKNALTFEDHMLWKKMLSIGKVCNIRQVLIKARFNPESVTIDEKWRGSKFVEIRRRSIQNGFVSDTDATALKQLIANQTFNNYKQASYYAMVGKKYLWNIPDGKKAREHFTQAIKHYPQNTESYLLYLFSFVPAALRIRLYKLLKK